MPFETAKDWLTSALTEWRRMTVQPGAPARLSDSQSAGADLTPNSTTGTNAAGRGVDLLILDFDPLDDADFYLGDDAVEVIDL